MKDENVESGGRRRPKQVRRSRKMLVVSGFEDEDVGYERILKDDTVIVGTRR